MGQYADLFDDQPDPRAGINVRLGAQQQPDKAAEALQLARRYSLPPAVAKEFVEDYRARAKAEDADAALAQHLAFWTGKDCARIERLIDGPALQTGRCLS